MTYLLRLHFDSRKFMTMTNVRDAADMATRTGLEKSTSSLFVNKFHRILEA